MPAALSITEEWRSTTASRFYKPRQISPFAISGTATLGIRLTRLVQLTDLQILEQLMTWESTGTSENNCHRPHHCQHIKLNTGIRFGPCVLKAQPDAPSDLKVPKNPSCIEKSWPITIRTAATHGAVPLRGPFYSGEGLHNSITRSFGRSSTATVSCKWQNQVSSGATPVQSTSFSSINFVLPRDCGEH